jgi:hypothetical protein
VPGLGIGNARDEQIERQLFAALERRNTAAGPAL